MPFKCKNRINNFNPNNGLYTVKVDYEGNSCYSLITTVIVYQTIPSLTLSKIIS